MDVLALKGWTARGLRGCGTAALLLTHLVSVSQARTREPFAARAGLDAAQASAKIWAEDAALVYVENDESVAAPGLSERWGYLFFSPASQRCRAYSIRDGKVIEAEDLSMDFVAPPVSANWVDSGVALAAAEEQVGSAFREKHAGVLSTMLLARGVFADAAPDQTHWLLIYTSPDAPSLFVVVDATEGKVRRTWRG